MPFEIPKLPTAFSIDRTTRRQPRIEDPAHLAFIRKLPSVISGRTPCEACHIRYGDALRRKKTSAKGMKPGYARDMFANAMKPGTDKDRYDAIEKSYAVWKIELKATLKGEGPGSDFDKAAAIRRSAHAVAKGETGIDGALEYFAEQLGVETGKLMGNGNG